MGWVGRRALRLWLAAEAVFYLYYRFKHYQLEKRTANAPLLPPGQTLGALKQMLETVHMIQSGGEIAEPHLSLSRSTPLLSAWDKEHNGPTYASAQDLQSMLVSQERESGMEELLRDWHDARRSAGSIDLAPMAVAECERTMQQLVDKAEILALKRAEASGWFVKNPRRAERWPTTRIGELRIGNVREWVAWAFFNCVPEEVPGPRAGELEELVFEIVRWMEMDVKPGYNAEASAMRLTMDPIPSAHRPIIYYMVTHAIFSQILSFQLRGLGFAQRFSGTLLYWHRPGPFNEPIVFCHGIGVNLLPYRPFLEEVIRRMPAKDVFCISLPHISMRIKEEVPSSKEMVACISDMLGSFGYSSAHFVGHSFGSLPMAWMAKIAPKYVSRMTFMDPVCFLLVKPDVCYNFMYRQPADPTQLLINYFLAQELYIAHSLSRNFFWHQNQLTPEELPGPTMVVLCGRDSIVPAHSVRRYLSAYRHKRRLRSPRILWFPDLGHGEINMGPVGTAACVRIVSEPRGPPPWRSGRWSRQALPSSRSPPARREAANDA